MKKYLVKIMNSKHNMELEEFACRFLENRGAALEKNEQGFEALMSEDLSTVLGTSEHININTMSDSEPEGAYSINYGSSFLEKMIAAACKDVPLLARQPLKRKRIR